MGDSWRGLRTAVGWWVRASGLPPPVRRFRRQALARSVRRRDLRAPIETLPPGELEILLGLARDRRLVAEVGTCRGWTAAALVLDDSAREVVSYDPFPVEQRPFYLDLLDARARGRIHLHRAPGAEAEPPPAAVDLLVIDCDHRRDDIVATFARWRPHLAGDAVVVFDDFAGSNHPGVREAVTTLGLGGTPSGRFFVWRADRDAERPHG
jgi:hypothetical protein